MTTRRAFMQQAAGVMFTSCALLDAAHAQPVTKRRQVTVGGTRAKVIDVHAHCVIPEAMALTGQKIVGDVKGQNDQVIVMADRLRSMDEQGIDMEALSINPVWYRMERDLVTKVIQVQNEKLAELCASKPERFVAYASLALQ